MDMIPTWMGCLLRLLLTIVATLTLWGCSDSAPPTAPGSQPVPQPGPAPPPRDSASLWVMVIDPTDGGICLLGSKVDVIVRGTVAQSSTITSPCDVWWVDGLFFNDLARGVEVTLRASAPGYVAREMVVTPSPSPGVLRATIIELSRIPAQERRSFNAQ